VAHTVVTARTATRAVRFVNVAPPTTGRSRVQHPPPMYGRASWRAQRQKTRYTGTSVDPSFPTSWPPTPPTYLVCALARLAAVEIGVYRPGPSCSATIRSVCASSGPDRWRCSARVAWWTCSDRRQLRLPVVSTPAGGRGQRPRGQRLPIRSKSLEACRGAATTHAHAAVGTPPGTFADRAVQSVVEHAPGRAATGVWCRVDDCRSPQTRQRAGPRASTTSTHSSSIKSGRPPTPAWNRSRSWNPRIWTR
jgi:hypothetical protein